MIPAVTAAGPASRPGPSSPRRTLAGLLILVACPAPPGPTPTPIDPKPAPTSATPEPPHPRAARWQPPPDVRRPSRDAVLTGLAPSATAAPTGKPDVLLITIDTIRADRLSLHGSPRPTSPWLDTFATRALVFDRAISTSPWTWPSMVSLATSLYPTAHGATQFDSTLCAEAATLAETFWAAGYVTGFVGANHYLERPESGYRQGFEFYWDRGTEPGERVLEYGSYFLDGIDADRPFFLHLHFYDPHCPYTLGQDRLPTVAKVPFGLAKGRVPPIGPSVTDDKLCHVVPPIDFALPEKVQLTLPRSKDRQDYLDAYDAELAHTDALLAEVEAMLRARGRWDSAVVAVTGDHGEEFGEHGRLGHGRSVYRETTWVPLVVRPPLAAQPKASIRHASPVSGIDVAPTLTALAGVPPAASWLGRDLSPLVRGEPVLTEGVAVYSETDFESSARLIERDGHRIVISSDSPSPQIFDVASDPMDLRPTPVGQLGADQLRAEIDRLSAVEGALRAAAPCAPTRAGADPRWIEALRTSGYLGSTSMAPPAEPPAAPTP